MFKMNLFNSLFGLYLWLVVLPDVKAACPPGWLHFENSCFFFSHEKFSWNTAQSSCQGHNAKLAEPKTKEVSDFLINEALNLQGKHGTTPYYLGAKDEAVEGTWVWMSSGEVMGYSAWGHGEPNRHTHGNCLTMYHTIMWAWSDDPCGGHFYFVCEKTYPADSSAVIG